MSAFVTLKTANGLVGLRSLTAVDLPAIADYWLKSPEEHLAFMGVDRKLLGSKEAIHTRFRNSIPTGDPNQRTISLGITLDEKIVGYTLLNRYSEDVNYSHWHIIAPNFRAKGISTSLYPYRIKAYFDMAPISQLIHQTRTRNIGVNRMLDKFIPVAETKYIEKPDGVAAPGEFHLRFVSRENIPNLFARAAELGTVPGVDHFQSYSR
jgi:RimJ/RimL family protein N-acetyltransferase